MAKKPKKGVPVEDWTPEQPSDWVAWMDKQGPLRHDELTDEQRKAMSRDKEGKDGER